MTKGYADGVLDLFCETPGMFCRKGIYIFNSFRIQ